jgi:cysteine desulfurase
MKRFAHEDFGNPSSSHAFGQQAARAIREARVFFSKSFNISPEQVIFTGSGSEADNLAVYGVTMDALAKRCARNEPGPMPRILVCSTEHPAVRKTAASLAALNIDVQFLPVDCDGQIDRSRFDELLTPETVLVSIQRVNNITGAVHPVEELARFAKERVPSLIFHTDAVQAFGRVDVPIYPSAVDLVAISAHKVEGPKGVGALLVLNKSLLKSGLRPLIWGGEQEGGFRSGTQNAGLIAGFHAAAERTLAKREEYTKHTQALRARLQELLFAKGLLGGEKSPLRWNSPKTAVPHIVSLSVPSFPSGPLAKLLEERFCLVSTGSACSSAKAEPDAVLTAMGLAPHLCNAAIRISFSGSNQLEEVDTLVNALDESIQLMSRLLGGKVAKR